MGYTGYVMASNPVLKIYLQSSFMLVTSHDLLYDDFIIGCSIENTPILFDCIFRVEDERPFHDTPASDARIYLVTKIDPTGVGAYTTVTGLPLIDEAISQWMKDRAAQRLKNLERKMGF